LDWPTFDAPLLQGIANAFLRRRKAIKYRTGIACDREFSESPVGTIERFNLETRAGKVRLSIWADGVLWLAVCVRRSGRNAGWAFQETFYGDVKDVSGEALVGMFEATLALPFGADRQSERQQLREVWARVRPYGK
jgi:hypothetical protein